MMCDSGVPHEYVARAASAAETLRKRRECRYNHALQAHVGGDSIEGGDLRSTTATATASALGSSIVRTGERPRIAPDRATRTLPQVSEPKPFQIASLTTAGTSAAVAPTTNSKSACISCEAQSKKAAEWLDKHILNADAFDSFAESAPTSSSSSSSSTSSSSAAHLSRSSTKSIRTLATLSSPLPLSSSSETRRSRPGSSSASTRRGIASSDNTNASSDNTNVFSGNSRHLGGIKHSSRDTSRSVIHSSSSSPSSSSISGTRRITPLTGVFTTIRRVITDVDKKRDDRESTRRKRETKTWSVILRVPEPNVLASLLTRNAMSALGDANKPRLLAQLRNHKEQPSTVLEELVKAFTQVEAASTFCYTASHTKSVALKHCKRFVYLCIKLNVALRQKNEVESERRARQTADAFTALHVRDVSIPSILQLTSPVVSSNSSSSSVSVVPPTFDADAKDISPRPKTMNGGVINGGVINGVVMVSQESLLRRLHKSRCAIIVGLETAETGVMRSPRTSSVGDAHMKGDEFHELYQRLLMLACVHKAIRDGDSGDDELHDYWYAQITKVTTQMSLMRDGAHKLYRLTPPMIRIIRGYAKVPFGSQ